MPKYEVVIKEIEAYVVTVTADSEYEASLQAWELLAESDASKYKYHYDSEGESEAFEIE